MPNRSDKVLARFEESQKIDEAAKNAANAKLAEDRLNQRARAAYFASNPGASESSYKEIEADLKRQLQLKDAVTADENRPLHSLYLD